MPAEVELDAVDLAGAAQMNMPRSGDLGPARENLMAGPANDQPSFLIDDEIGLAGVGDSLRRREPRSRRPVDKVVRLQFILQSRNELIDFHREKALRYGRPIIVECLDSRF